MFGISGYSITLFTLLVIFVLPEQLLDPIQQNASDTSPMSLREQKKRRTSSLFEFDSQGKLKDVFINISTAFHANFNPAVTIAEYILQLGKWKKLASKPNDASKNDSAAPQKIDESKPSFGWVLSLIICQIIGTLLGEFCMYLGIENNDNMERIWYLCPHTYNKEYGKICKDHGKFTVFFAEMVGSFIMANVFLSIRSLNKYQDNLFNPLFIAFATFISLMMFQNISGASLNPAIGLVQIPF